MENVTTTSSGREVEKATSMNPILVFPKPVTLAKLTELVIAKLLALIKTASEEMRTAMFPILPSCSNTLLFPPLIPWKRNYQPNISFYLLLLIFKLIKEIKKLFHVANFGSNDRMLSFNTFGFCLK
jgi:hypothetical protein